MYYTKMRATFSANNTKMEIRVYGGDDGFHGTVQEARALTSLNPFDEGITLTR